MVNYAEFLENASLYACINLSVDDLEDLIILLSGSIKLNIFCETCGEKRVFHLSNPMEFKRASQNLIRFSVQTLGQERAALVAQNLERAKIDLKNISIEFNNRCLDFVCAYDATHHVSFFLRTIFGDECEFKLIKAGQYPSVATLATADLKRYQSVLPTDYRNEYSRALGLFSHGIGIGSFVYLRRIFEKLVLDAFEAAKKDGKLTEDDFNFADEKKRLRRMEEKIKLLVGYLPDTIIDNAGIYGILSVGVHELSEDDCLKYFPVVDTGIQIMLDDYLEKKNRKKREGIFAKEIAKIKGEVK